jgi:hypothetical protein
MNDRPWHFQNHLRSPMKNDRGTKTVFSMIPVSTPLQKAKGEYMDAQDERDCFMVLRHQPVCFSPSIT